MALVRQDDLDWDIVDEEQMPIKRKQLGAAADGTDLGCSLYALDPGQTAWPYHYHTGNEEAIYVLSGSGSIRLDGETQSLRAGAYVALPADERGAHRVNNDGDEPLRYLVMSTMREPDITVYPDSEKIGVYAGSPPGGEDERTVEGYYRTEDSVDYWDGE